MGVWAVKAILVGVKLLGLMEWRYSNDWTIFAWDVHETNWVNEMGEDFDFDVGFNPPLSLDFQHPIANSSTKLPPWWPLRPPHTPSPNHHPNHHLHHHPNCHLHCHQLLHLAPPPRPLYKQRSWSLDTYLDEACQRHKSSNTRHSRHRSKSITNQDLDGLKACIEMGFSFELDGLGAIDVLPYVEADLKKNGSGMQSVLYQLTNG